MPDLRANCDFMRRIDPRAGARSHAALQVRGGSFGGRASSPVGYDREAGAWVDLKPGRGRENPGWTAGEGGLWSEPAGPRCGAGIREGATSGLSGLDCGCR